MGIFDRLSTLIKSNLNDLISSAENPEKMLNQIIVDMRNQLAKAKQQVAAAIADEKRLKDQAEAEFKLADDWEKRAMLAVQEGREMELTSLTDALRTHRVLFAADESARTGRPVSVA